MRKKRLSLNLASSFILEIVQILSALILPKFIIRVYGSSVNGLVNSLGQFLSAISLLEFGIGSVIRSALYKPLADKDRRRIDDIMSSSNSFYRKIGVILLIYVILLVVIYPSVVDSSYKSWYIPALILVLSITSFAQYYFGCIDGLLLDSDQRGYINTFSNIISIITNTIVSILLIVCGFGIHFVKLFGALVFVCRAVIIHCFVKRKYSISYKAKYDKEPIDQKWNGVAQHLANYVLESTDIIVLTIFSSLEAISVYSVYLMAIRGIKQLFVSMSGGFQALMGEYYAKRDYESLSNIFNIMEWFYGTFTTFAYGCTAFLIVPFVTVYTKNIVDADYYQPCFAVIMTIAFWVFSNNTPYHRAILAAGHYKQTQYYFILAAVINLTISIATVKAFGLIGVAIGTLLAMIFQTTWMIVYNINHISKRKGKLIIKQLVVDGIVIIISSIASSFIQFGIISWISWVIMGFKVAAIWGVVSITVNIIFYKKDIFPIIKKYLQEIHSK